jgi:hypothetical protein
MAMQTDLTQEQKAWVVRVTHVLGSTTPSSTFSTDGKLSLGQIKVSLRDADQSVTDKARHERSRALIVPREHGAWGLLLVPMVTGAGIALRQGSNLFPFVLLLTTALALFWLRTPLESLLGISAMRAETKEERQTTMFAVFYLGAVSVLALSMLLWGGHNSLLWPLGAAAGFFFGAQALLKIMWRQPRLMWRRPPRPSREAEGERPRSKHSAQTLRMLSEIVGTIGLTAAAPSAYYVITGKLDPTAWVLWIANLLFAGNQIHYVQLRIHTARVEGLRAKFSRGWAFALGQLLLTAALTFACVTGLFPKFASLAFAPLLFRGWFYFIQKPAPLAVRKLGWSELAQAIAFCILFISIA